MPITPYLYYRDVDQAMTFLAKAFGFRYHGVKMRGRDGKTSHAAMKLGASVVMMGRPATVYRNPTQLGQATQSLYVTVRGIDRHFSRAKQAGAAILEAPNDTEYGHRRYGASDPEGHQWYFAQVLQRPRAKRKARKRR